MIDFGINEMLDMQKRLQDQYKDKWKWEKLSPEAGKHKLLWMIGEIGEVIDIVKKHRRDIEASHDTEIRKDLVEEMLALKNQSYSNEVLKRYYQQMGEIIMRKGIGEVSDG